MNKVVLIGRLVKDPVLKYISGSGTAVTTVTIAIDRRISQNDKKEADFIPVVIWGKSAESTVQHMEKGLLMGVSGRLQTRSYDHKDGYRAYVTEVVAEEVKFLQRSNEKGKAQNNECERDTGNYEEFMTPIDQDDIPF